LIEEGQLAVMDERPISVQLLSNRRVKTGWSRSVFAVRRAPVFALQTARRVAFSRALLVRLQVGSIPAAPTRKPLLTGGFRFLY